MKFLKKIIVLFSICAGILSCTGEEGNQQKTYSILFTENPIMVGANGGSLSAIFISDYQWTADAVDSWISDVSVSDGEVSFTVEANHSEEPRDGKIRFSVSGDSYTQDLTVRQTGNSSKLKVEKTEVALATKGERLEIKVTSGENWTATATGEWLTAERKNSTTLELYAKPNFSGNVLNADVTVQTSSGKEKATIKVTQKADDAEFGGASTPQGREFVYKSNGLVTKVLEESVYNVGEHVKAFEMQFRNQVGSSISPYSIFLFEVDVTKDVTILASCSNDDPASIKKTDKEETILTTIRDQFYAMQNKRPEVEVLCGVNGDFCYGGEERLNLLHGIMYKDGVCLKDTFDGGSVCTVFAMMKDGTAKIMNQSQYASQKNNIQEAVGGRQALIVSGQTVNFTDTRLEPRTSVGVSKDGDKVYLLIVDGRRDAYSIGASYALLAQIFHIYNVYDAINLDGGGSSTFLVKDATANKGFKTRNRPTDNTGDRKLPNGLAVVRKK
jgi:hypothetical protein